MRSKWLWIVLIRPDQANLLPPEHVIGPADSLDTSWSTRIRDCFVQMAQGDPGGSFWALSYDNAVLAPCEQLKLTHGLQISSKHLRELISNSSELLARPPTSALAPAAPRRFGPLAAGYAPRAIPPTFQPASTLSLAEGIELAKRVLLQGKHTSVESALRPDRPSPQNDVCGWQGSETGWPFRIRSADLQHRGRWNAAGMAEANPPDPR